MFPSCTVPPLSFPLFVFLFVVVIVVFDLFSSSPLSSQFSRVQTAKKKAQKQATERLAKQAIRTVVFIYLSREQ